MDEETIEFDEMDAESELKKLAKKNHQKSANDILEEEILNDE